MNASKIIMKAILSQWVLNEKFLKVEIKMISDQKKEAWYLIIFFFKKLKFIKSNYDIHDLKLLIIVWVFKHWKHYLKNNFHLIWVLTDHENLWYFFMTKKLNQKQTCWAKKFVTFNFYIEYQTDKRNSADRSSRWSDYESVDNSHTKLLLIF